VEAISPDEARATFKLLLGSGAAIDEMNCVRKHLSRISGGRLAAAAGGDVLALAISDVPGDALATIASGPTVPDPTTFADAQRILQKFNLWDQLPASVRTHVERGLADAALETPKPGDPCLARTQTHLLGGIADALAAGAAAAAELGLRVEPARQPLQGDARGIGKLLARLAREHSDPLQRPMFPDGMLFGGETTVTLTGSGHGGRNQEVALRAAFDLEKLSVPVVVLSAGSDGVDGVAPDGVSAVAGALATPLTMPHARELGVDGQALLLDNDSYEFFARINPQLDGQQPNVLPAWGGHVHSGPTHCNVMDIFLVLGAPMAIKQAPPKV
jgi:hydroxypyruvate reductase